MTARRPAGEGLATRIVRWLESLPDRLIQGTLELSASLAAATTWRGRLLGFALLAGLVTAPAWAGRPLLSVLGMALWFAYAGQAWNLAGGFAGQLSLGHALFVGLGALAGGGLLVPGVGGPWFGLLLAVPAAAAAGAGIGALGCRCGLSGTHFALVTLAGAELGRVVFSQIANTSHVPGPTGAGGPGAGSYYVILAMALAGLVVCRLLAGSRLGWQWQAVREDPTAAAAAGVPVTAVRISALTVSAALTAPAGVFLACSASPPAPDQLVSLTRSLEILLGTVVGGIGTLFGPVLGALVIAPVSEALTALTSHATRDLSALKPFCYGLVLVVIVMMRPGGLWPWLARRLRLVPLSPGPKSGDRP